MVCLRSEIRCFIQRSRDLILVVESVFTCVFLFSCAMTGNTCACVAGNCPCGEACDCGAECTCDHC